MKNSNLPQFKLLHFFPISSLFIITSAELTYINQYCYDYGNYSSLSNYHNNIKRAISALTSKASTTYYNTHTIGLGEDRVNAFFSCRYDISPQVCQSCVASFANNISWCVGRVESLIVYEECTLHYSNRSIFAVMEDLPQLQQSSWYDAENQVQFNHSLENLFDELLVDVTSEYLRSSRFFATKMVKYSLRENIYALAQCNPDITSIECRTCLQNCFSNFTNNAIWRPNFELSVYDQIFTPSCRLSYVSTQRELCRRPWRFRQTYKDPFGEDCRPSSTPENSYPSAGTRANSIIGAIMITSIFYVGLLLKLLL